MNPEAAAQKLNNSLTELTKLSLKADALGQLFKREGVEDDREFQRIDRLPRREYTEEQELQLAKRLTEKLKTPKGTQELRGHQAVALYEAFSLKGLFCPLRAGGGKTLISYLLSRCMGDNIRMLLLVPAKLKAKTLREMHIASKHWDFPTHNIRVESYELLGRKQGVNILKNYKPNLIVADEVHKLRNRKAACTKRIQRYGEKHKPMFVGMSGTITKRSLLDYAHIVEWCLGIYSPLPTAWKSLEQWSSALDENTAFGNRFEPGVLLGWAEDGDWKDSNGNIVEELRAVRKAVGRRFRQSVGWVQARENRLGISLIIEHEDVQPCEKTLSMFEHLNKTWTSPNDWPIADGLAFSRHRKEVAQGFYYEWDPYPPKWWLACRAEWATECRHILNNNRRDIDSEALVVMAVEAGQYPGPARSRSDEESPPNTEQLLFNWLSVRDKFELKTKPIWFSDFMVDAAARWAKKNTGIIWIEHTAFGHRLAEKTGLPYYGSGGTDAKTGRFIESEDGSKTILASIASNYAGRNLQMFSHNYITSQPPNGPQNEQLYARTHRDGQQEDEVYVTIAMSCIEHAISYHRSRDDAFYSEDTLAQDQRILYANDLVPAFGTFASRKGFNWTREDK